MKLYEFEAKNLLKDYGMTVPDEEGSDYVVKAQVLTKNRKKHGGIKFASNKKEAERISEEMKGKEVNGHKVENTVIEKNIDFTDEYYVGLIYDTDHRSPVLIFSQQGGTGVESNEANKLVLEDADLWRIRDFLKRKGVKSDELNDLSQSLQKAVTCFFEEDARMLEINPLVRNGSGYVVLDAMIDLEEDASFRQERNYEDRSAFPREKTDREIEAQKIDENDHRGIAGKYTELEGDIGMMLAGGGASLTNMDALISYGGKPANYTEYGGNPPTEKVYKLSKIVMSKPGLNGLWHVGGTANNTDIYRTMKGFCQALKEIRPEYPIVIRRDGPYADRAFEMLRKTRGELELDMKLFRNDVPMTKTAKILMEKVEASKEGS